MKIKSKKKFIYLIFPQAEDGQTNIFFGYCRKTNKLNSRLFWAFFFVCLAKLNN